MTVEDLSRRFFISLPTAYRDLRRLEQQRLIIRGDGGAMPVAAEKGCALHIRRKNLKICF